MSTGTGTWLGWSPRDVEVLFDGDVKDVKDVFVWLTDPQHGSGKSFFLDMGVQYTVASIRFYPRVVEEGDPEAFPKGYIFSDNFMTEYRVHINDGTEETKDYLKRPEFTMIEENTENHKPYVRVDLDPPRMVQYIQLEPGRWMISWEIAEWEVYGEGYVPSALYTSGIMDLKASASWGNIRWEGIGVTDPEAKLIIQTRTGSDPDPTVYWRKTGYADDEIPFDDKGRYYTKSNYEKFSVAEKGRTTYDTEHWSHWSPPYSFEEGLKGTPITSPGPRRYIQIKVTFLPSRLDGGRIDGLSFEYTQPPVARDVVGEIWPDQVEPAEDVVFTIALRPTIEATNSGFDRLRIRTPMQAEVLDVRIEEQDVSYKVEEENKERFEVSFPRMRKGDLLEVDFRCRVLMYGTSFDGWVWDSERPGEVYQQINGGDAKEEWGSDGLSVRTSLEGSLLVEVGVSSEVLTPNGDQVNDTVRGIYTLLQLTGAAPIRVGIYDLEGRMVREVYRGEQVNGEYPWEWDGTDSDGEVVGLGAYLYRIEVEADDQVQVHMGTLSVVY